jgi:hypothetical protein
MQRVTQRRTEVQSRKRALFGVASAADVQVRQKFNDLRLHIGQRLARVASLAGEVVAYSARSKRVLAYASVCWRLRAAGARGQPLPT